MSALSLPIAFGALAPAEKGWLQVMKNMELCVEEAAVNETAAKLVQVGWVERRSSEALLPFMK